MKKPPGTERGPMDVVTVLSLSPSEADHVLLEKIFSHSNWTLYNTSTLRSARAFMEAHQLPMVLCECDLQPGTWKDVLEQISLIPDPPILIVTSRLADDCLWAEALNLGVYDVLAKPFDKDEVFRVVSLAWLHWKSQHEKPAGQPKIVKRAGS